MGIYLSQLPPTELARLKAELAETIIANFCYPRFFDYRSESLRVRPVDRSKRQEVWLYLNSVDFTTWNRVDLMSADFQRQVERLFIQFVQRNRSFFGDQGRKRMSDIRMLISSSSTTVAQGLQNHLKGQQEKKSSSTFGSPRSSLSWSFSEGNAYADIGWEQIAAPTMLLQQQLQEMRGESKTLSPHDGLQPQTPEMARRATSASGESIGLAVQQASSSKTAVRGNGHTTTIPPLQKAKGTAFPKPSSPPQPPPIPAQAPAASSVPMQKQEVPAIKPIEMPGMVTPLPVPQTTGSSISASLAVPVQSIAPTVPVPAVPSHPSPQASGPSASSTATGKRENPVMLVGEDDIAIFEQMRHQMLVWLRVEAVHLGLDITNQSAAQLLDLLRHQERFDETRLQVVSTLLNLANQVIKNEKVSVLDYKQALMFHLMHTKHTYR